MNIDNKKLEYSHNSTNARLVNRSVQREIIAALGPYDVLCGRSSASFNNIGNRRFRVTISMNLKKYMAANTRSEKSQVIEDVVALLREEIGARFLKESSQGFIELGEAKARGKVGHALRDLSAKLEPRKNSIPRKPSSQVLVVSQSFLSKLSEETTTIVDCDWEKKRGDKRRTCLVNLDTLWSAWDDHSKRFEKCTE